MSAKENCQCGEAPKMIYSCSGAADVGEIADRAARKLGRDGVGKMSCPIDCARKTLEKAGIGGFAHLRVTDHGLTKGQSPVTDENIKSIADKGAALFSS
jgi:uncharacterized metal-binding protein